MRLIRLAFVICVVLALGAGSAAAASKSAPRLKVIWMPGFAAPGTPARYDRVGVIKVGPATARDVLVLEPGTSAGAAYFVPLAQWIVSRLPGWQVWAVERRENLLEDQSALNRAKAGEATPTQVFNYYLGWLVNSSIKRHFRLIPPASVAFAKNWGLNVAIEDLHRVIRAARRLGGKVVLGGHSLGGAVVTAYATWNFGGRPGADELAGLVYIDGGSFRAVSANTARSELSALNAPSASPWLAFGNIPSPLAGLFSATGSLGALLAPNQRSLGQSFPLLNSSLKPPVPATNLAQYGYSLSVGTSPAILAAAQAHLGRGVFRFAGASGLHGWNGAGALTPIRRYATMFSGIEVQSADGAEWYFPERLTLDSGAVGNGLSNPAQGVLAVHSTLGRRLPHRLLIYAFAAALGGPGVLLDARLLAAQSHIPAHNLVLVDRHTTYAHNDPAGAYPNNAFFRHLLPFLARVAASR